MSSKIGILRNFAAFAGVVLIFSAFFATGNALASDEQDCSEYFREKYGANQPASTGIAKKYCNGGNGWLSSDKKTIICENGIINRFEEISYCDLVMSKTDKSIYCQNGRIRICSIEGREIKIGLECDEVLS